MPEGLLVVDKPTGWTSHDVVARTRRLLGTRRVGHAGTLDPMATGVLVLGVGRATRLLTFLVGCDKAYTATVRLGQTTVTDDAEGESVEALGVSDPATLEAALPPAVSGLTGTIEQVPSAVSAVKIDGVRSYARVRSGEDVELAARTVRVSRFDVLRTTPERATTGAGQTIPVVDVDIEVEVSSGTYVRALARDLGRDLGVGGHLTALRRTRVGAFTLASATSLDALVERSERAGVSGIPLLSMAEAARAQLPVREVTAQEADRLSHGRPIAATPSGGDAVAAIDPIGRLVAILDETRPTVRSRVVFPVT
ncbi:MAG: tRNA pseudouridine(55) synthase TruB [Intrasporangium sp.]|uniref:tRNA pseudouridine(55) synthase TruB n=1 Tax=Intrasporangium sp. TaxID=1925024 RepID=UPI0026489C6F|nr:tRNA pseudouridine(55) synthase TruB [Intrasporangium sp.]MDN5794209.1 tRNA pseudouridine(55) synthase TruB [Intrasporangium sp.]